MGTIYTIARCLFKFKRKFGQHVARKHIQIHSVIPHPQLLKSSIHISPFHHPIPPLFQYSIIPKFQYSNIPFFQHSSTPSSPSPITPILHSPQTPLRIPQPPSPHGRKDPCTCTLPVTAGSSLGNSHNACYLLIIKSPKKLEFYKLL